MHTPRLEVSKVDVKGQGEAGEVVFQLTADKPAASVMVTYRWDAKEPVLRKFIEHHQPQFAAVEPAAERPSGHLSDRRQSRGQGTGISRLPERSSAS